MLDTLIKKLAVVLILCGAIVSLIYFTDLGALVNGQAKKKVEEFKKETKEKIEKKKEEVKKEVKKVEDKVESNVDKVEDKIKDLKKLKLKDIIK